MSSTIGFNDYRKRARRRLPDFLFDYIDGGACDEITMRENLADLASLRLKQRVLIDVDHVDSSVSFLGDSYPAPLILGPVGFSGMFARRGEVQAARAAEAMGIPMCLSALSICSIEELCGALGKPPWFQLYMIRDRGYMKELLERVARANVHKLVFTVDFPVPGKRYKDARSGLAAGGFVNSIHKALSALKRPSWMLDVFLAGAPHQFGHFQSLVSGDSGLSRQWKWVADNFDASVGLEDLHWLRENWSGELVVKGIMDPLDAGRCLQADVDGLVVSNHGGRQLDGVPSTISVLPSVVEAVGGAVPVFVDGGIRTGNDVLKAIALGAKACLLGRSWAFALAARGERGVIDMLDYFVSELHTAMALSGINRLEDASSALFHGGQRYPMPTADAALRADLRKQFV